MCMCMHLSMCICVWFMHVYVCMHEVYAGICMRECVCMNVWHYSDKGPAGRVSNRKRLS